MRYTSTTSHLWQYRVHIELLPSDVFLTKVDKNTVRAIKAKHENALARFDFCNHRTKMLDS